MANLYDRIHNNSGLLVKSIAPVQTPASPSQGAGLQSMTLPPAWQAATYGPGWPIQPLEQPFEDNIPREIDYPVSANINLQPRVNYGLMPYSALATAFENVTEVKMSIHTLTREFTGFTPRLLGVNSKNEVKDHPYSWLLEAPDRVTPFSVWITRFLQSTTIFDAGAVHIQRGQGNLQALNYVDGSTLFAILDVNGRVPQGQDDQGRSIPAYTQIIKGTPFQWYTTNDIWYKPRFRRYNAPYGMPGIEDAWAWIMVIANITGFSLAHYQQGNMPEGWMEGPENYTIGQVDFWEQALNARMSAGPTERNRIRVVPYGFKYTPTKPPEFPLELYERALDNITLSYGIPPSEFGKTPGAGLGGKGFLEVMQSSLYRMALQPLKLYAEDMFNSILRRFDVDDVVVDFAVGTESIDPAQQREGVLKELAAGLLSLNEARAQLGYEKIPGGDVRVVINGANVVILDDYLKPGAMPTINQQLQDKPQVIDQGTVEQALQLLRNGIPVKKYSFATVEKGLTHPKANGRFAPKAKLSPDAALRLGNLLGVDWNKINLDQFLVGVNEETEHLDSVDGDMETVGRIALDHLEETPDYYDKLHQAVEPSAQPENAVREALGLKVQKVGGSFDTTMVALYPPIEIAEILCNLGIQWPEGSDISSPQDLHITLAIVEGTQSAMVQDAVQAFCDSLPENYELAGLINGIGRFFECHIEGMNVIYCNVDLPTLPSIRQALVTSLESAGFPVKRDHGFVPHMTLAYIPATSQINDIQLDPLPIKFNSFTISDGNNRQLVKAPVVQKLLVPDLTKHCGVCPGDDIYYKAPLISTGALEWPDDWHANEVNIVAMQPEVGEIRPALWKPISGEMPTLNALLGGSQSIREEACYITDRLLGFFLVPVAYTAEIDGEAGAIMHYVPGKDALKESRPAGEYGPLWIEKAGAFDYLTGQLDRHSGNWLTHPDDQERLVLIDNGMSLSDTKRVLYSPFIDSCAGKELSSSTMLALKILAGLDSYWQDMIDMLGSEPVMLEKARLEEMISTGMIPVREPGDKYATLGGSNDGTDQDGTV